MTQAGEQRCELAGKKKTKEKNFDTDVTGNMRLDDALVAMEVSLKVKQNQITGSRERSPLG